MRHLTIKLLPFAAGFILAALLFNVGSLSAQTGRTMSADSSAYVTQAVQRLNALQKFYAVNNSVLNGSATFTDVVKIHQNLIAITKEMDKQAPPIELLAYHSQFQFAAQRCENLALDLEYYKTPDNLPLFRIAPFYIEKENCTNQIHEAWLRLIDYASSYNVDISKSVQISTTIATSVITSTIAVRVTPIVGDNKGGVDQLGIFYEFTEVDPSIKVTGWEAYENHDGYWSVAGNIQNKHSTDRFSVVDFKVRFYKGQRLIQVAAISAGGRWVPPGQSLPFEFTSSVKLKEFDRYTVEVTVGDWGKAP